MKSPVSLNAGLQSVFIVQLVHKGLQLRQHLGGELVVDQHHGAGLNYPAQLNKTMKIGIRHVADNFKKLFRSLIGDEGALSLPDLHQAIGGQNPHPLPQGRPAYADRLSKNCLIGQLISNHILAALDGGSDVTDHLIYSAHSANMPVLVHRFYHNHHHIHLLI